MLVVSLASGRLEGRSSRRGPAGHAGVTLAGPTGLIAVVLGFLILIAPHEAGHFTAAKLTRMQVHEFSIGFGTRLLSVVRRGTLYALRLIPLGGYVRIAGMEPGEYDLPDGFHRKPALARLAVLFAGPLANFILASILVAAVIIPDSAPVRGTINEVLPGSPAAAAGLRPGDLIQTAGGQAVNGDGARLREIEDRNGASPLEIVVLRSSGAQYIVNVKPHYDSQQQAYVIGVRAAAFTTPEAVTTSLEYPWFTIRDIAGGIWMLATGQVPGGLAGPEGVTGPIGISNYLYQSAAQGPADFLTLLALLSVALGLTNLLPLPALDGGRIVVVLAEAIRRRPFDRARELGVQRFGLVALLILVAFISYLDITRIVNHQFPH